MTTKEPARHAERSAALFNNRHLVAIVNAIEARPAKRPFTTRQLAVATDLPDSLVRPVVQRLLAANLIWLCNHEAGSRGAKYYEPVDDSAWLRLELLCGSLADS